MSRRAIHLCFFLSGFSGLVGEVVWSRLLSYTLGSSHLSIALVVSTFMAGLALGSALGGPLADRSPSPLRLYGWLVAAIGVLSALVPFALTLANPLLGAVYRLHDGEPGHPLFAAVRILVCGGTILVPTVLMGATLPALVRHVTRAGSGVGEGLGTLYGVNSLGAVAGTAAAGFWLVRTLGLDGTIALGAGTDLAVGVAVLLATRGERALGERGLRDLFPPRRAARAPGDPGEGPAPREPLPAGVRLAVLAFGIAGFVNLCLQLGWTRALVLAIGNSTYAFSLILSVFILGLALGGWLGGLFADRISNPERALGVLLVATAIASAATIPWLGLSPARFAVQLAEAGAHRGGFSYASFLSAALTGEVLVILPATILMGAALPLVGRLRAEGREGVGRAIGAAYAANTIGAIAGTALAGFVLIPLFSRVFGVLYLAVAIGLSTGALLWWHAPGRGARRAAWIGSVLAAVLALGFVTRPHGVLDGESSRRAFWHPVVHSLGGYLNAAAGAEHRTTGEYTRAQIERFEPLYYSDGGLASVGVLRDRVTGRTSLNISGKPDASDGEDSTDRPTQLLLGHLPALLHPAPRTALNLGLGGGMTLGALCAHPEIESIDLLELIPQVEEAARLHFRAANRDALTDPRVRRIIGDGRNHITHTARRYDIITSEPSNFWIAGIGSLFTEEFYALGLSRLEEGGIFCQWLYGYSIRDEDYRTALRTFDAAFPQALVWSSYWGDTLLIGAREEIPIDAARIAAALAHPAVAAELTPLGIRAPEDLGRYLQCSLAALRGWIGEGPLHRDLSPVLEYTAPLGFYDPDRDLHHRLQSASGDSFPEVALRGFDDGARARADLARRGGRALRAFRLELTRLRLPEARAAWSDTVSVGDPWSTGEGAFDLLRARELLASRDPGALDRFREIRDTPELFLAGGRRAVHPDGARALIGPFAAAAENAPPDRPAAHIALAIVLAQSGRNDEALAALDGAAARGAPPNEISGMRAVFTGAKGDLPGAEALLRRAIAETPPERPASLADHWYNLGYCLEQQGRSEEAAIAYLRAARRGWDGSAAAAAMLRALGASGIAGEPVRARIAALGAAPPRDDASLVRALREVADALERLGHSPAAEKFREASRE